MLPDLADDFTAFGGGATGYDMSRSASNSTNMDTISPHELLMSAPNSGALTALTSPSIYTPDCFEVSPAFANAEWDDASKWPSLFPDDNTAASYAAEASPAMGALDVDQDGPASGRRKSSNMSPKSSSNRHSLHAGVNARKRDKPLPPIVIDDPNDTIAVKRARNTLAARKSRERKAAKVEELEEMIDQLKAEIAQKDADNTLLKGDRDYWKDMAARKQ